MQTKQFLSFGTQIRSLDEKRRRITFVASTETPDRYSDVVRVSGWRLDNYRRNPIVLFQHRSGDPPVARCTNISIETKPVPALVQEVEFAPKSVYPFAETVWQLYKNKFLNAVSVGFLPLEEPTPRIDPDNGRMLGYEYTSQELLELSCVNIPAQPDALARAVKKGIITSAQAKNFDANAALFERFVLDLGKGLNAEEGEFDEIRTLDQLYRALRA
jgi:hypothetical protein